MIELLVVISIISVLIAILLPSLQAAREQSQGIQCGSNERQMGLAFSMYSNDWKDHIPLALDTSVTTSQWQTTHWAVKLIPYMTTTANPSRIYLTSSQSRGKEFWFCAQATSTGVLYPSFGINGGIAGYKNATGDYSGTNPAWPLWGNVSRKITVLRNPTRSLLLGELSVGGVLFEYIGHLATNGTRTDPDSGLTYTNTYQRVAFRHRNAANILFFDGHVELQKQPDEGAMWVNVAHFQRPGVNSVTVRHIWQ